jgi:PAS domain S-box-containing protein
MHIPGVRRRDPGLDPVPYPVLHQRIADSYAPASVLVSPDDKVLHLSSNAGRFLVHPGGELTSSIFKLVRDELQLELRNLLHSARERSEVRRSGPITVRLGGEPQPVVICVQPVMDPSHEGFALVLFEEPKSTNKLRRIPSAPSPRRRAGSPQEREEALREELDHTRQRLQAIIEEYETSQEEMRASNEEMQSTNEELRSTMEELETSKEELQSMNEELQTVNQENRHKVEELAQLTGDLQNLLTATDIATLFLDRDLRIMRFTPKVSELFNVRMTDRSRPITDLTSRLGYAELPADSARVLSRLVPIEREVEDQQGRWYLTRVMPYRSPADRIEGVVITFVEITARKLAERELRLARDHAELILDALPEPVLVLTSDLSVSTANSAFYRHFGLDPADTVGRGMMEIGTGEWNGSELPELLERLRRPGASSINGFEITHRFGDRGRMVLLLNGRRLEEEQLIVLGFHDITARQEALEDLRVSQKRLAHMINTEGIGVFVFDQSGTIIDANDAFLGMLGQSRLDVNGGRINWRSLTPPDYVDVTEEQHRRLQATGRLGPYEREYLRSDGTRVWVLSVGASLGDGSTVKYCIDISHRKAVESALKESEVQLASELAAVTRLHDLIARLLVSPDLPTALGEVLAASIDIVGDEMGTVQIRDPESGRLEIIAQRGMPQAFMEHFRYAAADDGSTCGRAMASGERVVVRDILTDPEYAPHADVARAAGYRAVQSTPLISRNGEVLGVLSTHYPEPHEPSDRELRILDLYGRQAAEFIEHVRNREEASAASRRKDEFLAILAHELRNPLAVIRNGLHLLKLSRENDAAFEHASAMMHRQTRQLTMLVDDLLDVSRITRGKLELRRRLVTIQSVVQDAIESSRAFMEEAGHEFRTTLPADPVHVDADPDRVAQTLSNLLHNAAKFTPEGGRIDLSVTQGDGHVVLAVSDTGIGMEPDLSERVFDLFIQGDRPGQPGESGLGIGLTLVRSIVAMHGGSVAVESEGRDRGSRFTIKLPVVEPSAPVARVERSTADISAAMLGQRRILIVDDNEDAAEMLRHILTVHGHQVFVATEGGAAVDMAREKLPDVVLMDLGMPGVSGYEAARRIRHEDWGRGLALVAVTGWGQDEDRRRSSEAGFDVHLVKPVDMRALQSVFTRFGRPLD